MRAYIVMLFTVLLCNTAAAQTATGKIEGKVIDQRDGKTLVGASVKIKETEQGNATDIEGRYEIKNVAAGTYTLVCTNIGYLEDSIVITVKAGESSTQDFILRSKVVQAKGAKIVRKEKPVISVNTLLVQQQNNSSIGNFFSAEEMKTQPIRTSSDALKKISGASIQDNKFAVIRGLSDRYNFALINGAPLPSSEADRKAFSFDIFPANLLDNMVITKTATPDMPGEFAGGIIALTTRDIPSENFYSVSLGASSNSITTFKPFSKYEGGKTDFLGLDDGTRAVPKGVPGTAEYVNLSREQLIAQSRKFNGDFSTSSSNAMPNSNFQFSMGHRFKLFKLETGSVFALTYNNTFTLKPADLRDFAGKDLVYSFHDDQYTRNVLWGGLWNLTMKLNRNNKISLKNTFNVNSEDQTILRTGTDYSAQTDRKSIALFFQENKLFSSQLIGDHYLKTSKIKIKWVGGLSHITRDIPDFRRLSYFRPMGDESQPYKTFFTTNASPNDGGRFYSNLVEDVLSLSYDVSKTLDHSFPFLKNKMKTEIKAGAYHQKRDRTFDARVMGYTIANSAKFNQDYYALPPDQIFQQQYIDTNGFVIRESTNKSDLYTANSDLNAGFLMLDNKFSKRVRLVWGVRYEHFVLNLHSYNNGPLDVNMTKGDWLPSANLTYGVGQKSNLRAAFSKTVSRPEFRELAPFSFFDFARFFEVVGNNRLQRTLIYNYDLKYELYPSAGQVVSVSAFYKKFQNPIEQVLGADIGAGTISTSFANAKSADNYGVELELRKKLDFISKTGVFSNMNLSTNLAYIQSNVDVSNIAGARKRPLQGQSPYVVNISLNYADTFNYSVTLSYNRIGKRIAFVGVDVYPDFYEKPRDVIDFQINKTIGKKLDLKFTISDLLAQNLLIYQNPAGDSNTNYQAGDNIMRSYKYGRSIGVGITYRF